MVSRRNVIVKIALGGASLALLAGCKQSQAKFHSLEVSSNLGRDLQLPDADGKTHQLADFRGKVVAVFFGYTMCPDVCPLNMTNWSDVKKQLGADGDRLQVVFVSVDPERDRPLISQYVSAFDPSFIGLTPANADQLAAVAREFNVYYRKVAGPTPTSYYMDHTATNYIYDLQGHLRLATRPNQSVQDITDDVRQLIKGA